MTGISHGLSRLHTLGQPCSPRTFHTVNRIDKVVGQIRVGDDKEEMHAERENVPDHHEKVKRPSCRLFPSRVSPTPPATRPLTISTKPLSRVSRVLPPLVPG